MKIQDSWSLTLRIPLNEAHLERIVERLMVWNVEFNPCIHFFKASVVILLSYFQRLWLCTMGSSLTVLCRMASQLRISKSEPIYPAMF